MLCLAAAEYDFNRWGAATGLPDNTVSAILQTRDGYIWFATERGLARFDGRRFVVFDRTNTPELAEDSCYALAEDAEGALWIGTRSNLARFHRGTFKLFRTTDFLCVTGIYRLIPRREGGIWVASSFGIARAQGDEIRCENVLPGSVPYRREDVPLLHEDEDGALWACANGILMRRESPQSPWMEIASPLETHNDQALGIGRAGDGTLWLLCRGRLYRREGGGWILEAEGGWRRHAHFPTFFGRDRAGRLWTARGEEGLGRIEDGRWRALKGPDSLLRKRPIAFAEDKEGGVWVGTLGSGVYRLFPTRFVHWTKAEGLPSNTVQALAEDAEGGVWIGTDGGLRRLINGRLEAPLSAEEFAFANVRALAPGPDSAMWIGGARGLARTWRGVTEEFEREGAWQNAVKSISVASSEQVWVGTEFHGVWEMRMGQGARMTPGTAQKEVLAMVEDGDGVIWSESGEGNLARITLPRETGEPVVTPIGSWDGQRPSFAWDLHWDHQGNLWLGTELGLVKGREGKFEIFGPSLGIPAGVREIVQDDFNRLWLGTGRGIFRVNLADLDSSRRESSRAIPTILYDEEDGLLAAEISGLQSQPAAIKTRDGRLWFATSAGLAMTDPRNLRDNPVPPAVVIEEVRVNDGVVFANDRPQSGVPAALVAEGGLRLPPGSGRAVEISYAAISFEAPERIRFRHELSGVDGAWVEAGTRRAARYTNLRPGRHVFRVTASNNHGVWNEAGAAVSFEILPFFSETAWFRWGAGGVLAALALVAGVWRLWTVKRRHRREMDMALHQQRSDIARDLHDDFGPALTLIKQLAENPEKLSGKTLDGTGLGKSISALANQAVEGLSVLAWGNNPRYDTLDDLAGYAREYAAIFLNPTSLETTLVFPEQVPARTVPGFFRKHLMALLKEALHNAVRHARASKVEVRLELETDRLVLQVRDDGCGFPDAEPGRFSNGLRNMRHRVGELGGELVIDSREGCGTRVRMVLPLPPEG